MKKRALETLEKQPIKQLEKQPMKQLKKQNRIYKKHGFVGLGFQNFCTFLEIIILKDQIIN
jgi:hypothetical protein